MQALYIVKYVHRKVEVATPATYELDMQYMFTGKEVAVHTRYLRARYAVCSQST